jgi:hypothetical protein
MADISSFLLSWWYTPSTKIAISFQTLAAKSQGFLDSTNGLSASVDENYRLENVITSHPVESGTNISDHIIVQPKIISITGLLTAIDTIQFLFDAADSRTLFTLTTGLYFGRSYFKIKNMAIQSIDIPRNNQYGRTSIKFSIVFKEMIITDTNPSTTNSSSQAAIDPNIGGIV